MDPQQRLFLQTAWAALEDAGYSLKSLAGRKIGVFVGIGNADYPTLMRAAGAPIDAYRATGIALTSIANRVSFALDFLGPSQSIDTACSSSLVAVHRAAAALRNGECEMCIVGGVNLLLGSELFDAFQSAGMLSPTGHCRVFDAAADGYVRGEGVAAIILRPLEAAEAARDHIYGVITASAENHGGRAHSFTAPNVNAQADVIRTAWKNAGASMSEALLLELHGTGTPLGDPIEFNGLKKALGSTSAPADGKIYLGLLKSHIGHLEAAAGIAGLIKTLLSLQRGIIPGNLHHTTTNPHIDFAGTPFELPNTTVEWDRNCGPRYAGVSSFGFGGVNAHVVLRSYTPHRRDPVSVPEVYLFPLSAKTKSALRARVTQLLNHISAVEAFGTRPDEAAPHAVCAAFGLLENFDSSACLTSHLAAPEDFAAVIENIAQSLGVDIDPCELRDVVTLRELTGRLTAMSGSSVRNASHGRGHLMPRTAVAPQVFDSASLSQVSFTLIEGRDVLRERVVFVAGDTKQFLQQMSAFLNAPDGATGPWQTGAPRTNAQERPTAGMASVGAEAWAEYFTKARDAALTWGAVSATPPPSRIPLPAYPFALTPAWYKAAKNGTTRNTFAVSSRSAELPTDCVAAWHSIWTGDRAKPKSSAAALPRLIHHLSQKHSNQIVLRDVRFGKPQELAAGDELRFMSSKSIVQCLSGATSQRVYLEALHQHTAVSMADYPLLPAAAPPSAAIDSVASLSPMIAEPLWHVRNITQSNGQITIDASPSKAMPGGLALLLIWSAIIAGARSLQNTASATHLAPFHINQIAMMPDAAPEIEQTVIRWNDQLQSASCVCTNANGDVVLNAEGLTLRAEPASAEGCGP